jgi:hypothetical protein
MTKKMATVDWEREWTVEASEAPLHKKLFPASGTSKFTLEAQTQGNTIVSYKLQRGTGMKAVWDEVTPFEPLGNQDLSHHDPRLPKHPDGTHPAKDYFKAVKKLEPDMGADTKKLRASLTVDGQEHTVTLLQAMGQLEGDEPMLIIKIKARGPISGGTNPDGSAVGHF